MFTDRVSKLLAAHRGDHPVGSDHVPEPPQVELASHSSTLFQTTLIKNTNMIIVFSYVFESEKI
jgi:hypothetical protein